MNLKKLIALRATKVAAMQTLLDGATAEERELSAEESTQYDNLMTEQEGLVTQIARAESQEKLNLEMAKPTSKPVHAIVKAQEVVTGEFVDDEKQFTTHGEFFRAVAAGSDPRLNIESNQNMGTGSTGGFSVPDTYSTDILISFTPEDVIVRPRAMVIPAGQFPDAKFSMPALDQSGEKGVYSGVVTKWLEEGGTISKTAFSLRKIELESKAIAAYIPISNKMLRNNEQMATIGVSLMGQALAKAQDDAQILGDGIGKPLGFMNHASAIAINRKTAGEVVYEDFVKMLAKSKGNMKEWIISQTLLAEILLMEDGSGKLLYTNGVSGVTGVILGYPVKWSERTPTIGVKGDVMLVDLSFYYIKDGSGLIIEASSQYQFLEDYTVFKVIANVDGQPSITTPLKLENGTYVSPFVILDLVAV